MKKDEILEMSRKENEGRLDEREMAAYGASARVGMFVGGILCAILALLASWFFHAPEIGLSAWLVYFAMHGSNYITLYAKLKARRHLVYGILTLSTAVVMAVALFVVALG